MKLAWITILVAGCANVAFGLSAPKTIREIQIISGWGGLGTPQNAKVTILCENGKYLRDGRPINAALVDAFLSSLNAPVIPKPQMENLGITSEWLTEASPWRKRTCREGSRMLLLARTLFESSFVDPALMTKAMSDLFAYASMDELPVCQRCGHL